MCAEERLVFGEEKIQRVAVELAGFVVGSVGEKSGM